MNDPSIARQRETRTKVRRCRLEKELCASCRFSPRTDADVAHPPGVHMFEQIAMARPISHSFVGEIETRCSPPLDPHPSLSLLSIAPPPSPSPIITLPVSL